MYPNLLYYKWSENAIIQLISIPIFISSLSFMYYFTYNPNIVVNAQTGTSYTLVVADAQKLVTLSNASAIGVTVASNATQALPVGTQITLTQLGAGQITVTGASSPNPVTIVSTGATAATPKSRAQYSTMTLIQTSTDNWLAVGDIA